MSDQPIRIALVGCGEHARTSHAAPLAEYAATYPGQIELAAACDIDRSRAESICRDFGFGRAYASVDELLDAGGFDACVTVMPMDRIGALGGRLLERGIPCVLEKPLGDSVEAAERLARVARETGTPHMVSVNRRFIPFLTRAAEWTKARGPLRHVRASIARHARSEDDFIWSTAIHVVDALRNVSGEVVDVDARAAGGGHTPTWYLLSLVFESGSTGHVEVLPTAGVVEETYELFGDGFAARVACGSATQRSLRLSENGTTAVEERVSGDEPEHRLNGSYEEVVEFVTALRDGRRPRPTVDDVLPSVRLCFAAKRACAP